MTTLKIPQNIDEVDWSSLSKEVSVVKSYTPEQREIYFENTLSALPMESQALGQSLFDLVPALHQCRKFNQLAKLDYLDKRGENGQLIRVAIARILERRFL